MPNNEQDDDNTIANDILKGADYISNISTTVPSSLLRSLRIINPISRVADIINTSRDSLSNYESLRENGSTPIAASVGSLIATSIDFAGGVVTDVNDLGLILINDPRREERTNNVSNYFDRQAERFGRIIAQEVDTIISNPISNAQNNSAIPNQAQQTDNNPMTGEEYLRESSRSSQAINAENPNPVNQRLASIHRNAVNQASNIPPQYNPSLQLLRTSVASNPVQANFLDTISREMRQIQQGQQRGNEIITQLNKPTSSSVASCKDLGTCQTTYQSHYFNNDNEKQFYLPNTYAFRLFDKPKPPSVGRNNTNYKSNSNTGHGRSGTQKQHKTGGSNNNRSGGCPSGQQRGSGGACVSNTNFIRQQNSLRAANRSSSNSRSNHGGTGRRK